MIRSTFAVAAVLAVVSVATAPARAQSTVAVTGIVVAVDPGTRCGIETHRLKGTGVPLISAEVALDDYLGVNVKVFGRLSDTCEILDVLSVEDPPPAALELCGTPAPGCGIRFRSSPGGLAIHGLLASAFADVIPINLAQGTLLVGSPALLLATGTTTTFQTAGYAFDFRVPPNAALVGVTAYVQGLRQDVPLDFPGPVPSGHPVVPPLRLSNVVCFTIGDAATSCATLDC